MASTPRSRAAQRHGGRVVTVMVMLPLLMSTFLGSADAAPVQVAKAPFRQAGGSQTQGQQSAAVFPASKKGGPKAVDVNKAPTGGAPATPWRPPLVNLNYQGGLVMSKPIRVYFIWYGEWAAATKEVIRTSVRSLTPATVITQTPNLANWWKIVMKYTQKNGLHVSNQVTIGGEVTDLYSKGKVLANDTKLGADIIYFNIKTMGYLPHDPEQGLYFLMTSSDVSFTADGFCGYHTWFCMDRTQPETSPFCSNIKNRVIWSFMPFPGAGNELLNSCNVYEPWGSIFLPAPNDRASPVAGALDSFISVLMHELMEAATDPYLDAWLHNPRENSEAGDLRAYSYGGGDFFYCELPSIYGTYHGSKNFDVCATYPMSWHAIRWLATGEIFNVFGTGGSKFLVQQIWSLASKGCQLQLQENCKASTTLTARSGVVERGVHVFDTIALQAYGPGENCLWTIRVPNAISLTLNFVTVATGYDALDHVDVYKGTTLVKKIGGVKTSAVVQVAGNSAVVKWTSYGGRSPFPDATGFRMLYTASF